MTQLERDSSLAFLISGQESTITQVGKSVFNPSSELSLAKASLLGTAEGFAPILAGVEGYNLGGELGGFGAIGGMFPDNKESDTTYLNIIDWDWHSFWSLTAFLSLMLAFMNILPIPALDGGHVVFLLYEIVVGKPAPEKVMEYAQMVGMILLLSLLVFANGNDLLKLF